MAITQETLLLSDHPSPRSRRSTQPLLDVGAWINGRYLLQGVVGKGGMATVFKALDTQTDRWVAIKIPLPKMFNVDGLHQRFAFEHAVTRALSGPHGVHVFDHGVHHQARKNVCGLPWIAMELLPGESLRTRLKRHGRFSPHQAIDILIPMLKGLRHAHRRGIIHRDLKPDNIFLVSAGDRCMVKIIDYGVALVQPGLWTGPSPPSSQGRRMIGTPAYMAPEQCLSRHPLTHAID
ncbi:MAG: serine/threonine-protein kinase, partial [Myxococcota bacterium]